MPCRRHAQTEGWRWWQCALLVFLLALIVLVILMAWGGYRTGTPLDTFQPAASGELAVGQTWGPRDTALWE